MLRRSAEFRWIVGFVCLAVALASCVPLAAGQPAQGAVTLNPSPQPTATPLFTATPVPTLPVPQAFHQAPMLDALVQLGQLEPLNSRLPDNPKVIKPVEKTGVYGGTWRMVIQPGADQGTFIRTVVYEPLLRWTGDWAGVEPNLIASYTVNRSATEYTFTLRNGIRWSDGAEFTTEDIRFWYNDVLLNKDLTPLVPAWLRTGNQVAAFEFLDSLTFKVTFRLANSLFLQHLATPEALIVTAFPAHYAKKFHGSYLSPDEASKMLKEGGYETWVEMFVKQVGVNSLDIGNFVDPKRPRLSAWVLKTPYVAGAKSVIWERNPYYWKVDDEGNQLPYIDEVVFNVTGSLDEVVRRAVDGTIDMQNLSLLGSNLSSGLAAHTAEDYYRFYPLDDGYNNVMVIQLNLAHQDPIKRQIFMNKDFRVALSYAINRQEIIDRLYAGKGMPWQAAPRKDTPFFDQDLATQYTRYDVTEANRLLDLAGYKRNTIGKRLGPDNQPISFAILVQDRDPEQIAILNMIARDWTSLGIDVQPQVLQLPIFLGTIYSNLHDAAVSRGGSTFFYDVLLDPSNYMPYGDNSYWAIPWAYWYNHVQGYESHQPDPSARSQMERYDQIRMTTNTNEQFRLMNFVMTFDRESFWNIGVALGPQRYGIVRHNFYNVPKKMPSAWTYPDPAPTNPEQYFITSE